MKESGEEYMLLKQSGIFARLFKQKKGPHINIHKFILILKHEDKKKEYFVMG